MPRQVLEFRVIIASPAELYDTRKAVFEVIRELDRTLESQRISIRGMGWEEYATPGVGSEVQDVVSHQILREYDILIALFATRLGTPTERHLSGTVEEIEHAIANTDSPKKELASFLAIAETLLNTLVENRSSIAGFRAAVSTIPRITIQFNQAKKLLLEAIDECQAFFDEVERAIFDITART